MSFCKQLPILALVLTCGAPLAAAAPVADASSQAVKDFKSEINARLSTLKSELSVLDAQFQTDLDALINALKSGVTTPSDAHVSAFDRLHALDADVAARLRAFTDGLELDASGHLANLVDFLGAFVVGDRGLVDDAVRRAALLRAKAIARNFKRVKAFISQFDKVHHYDIVVDRRGQLLDPVTPSLTDAEADMPFVPLRIDLLVGGSDRDVIADGRLCLAGTADVNNAATVDVSITLPGGTPVTALATAVDSETGRWRVCFPATGVGDLPEGNYSIIVTQGGISISDSVGVQ